MASFILAIANCNNLEFADARKSADEPEIEFIRQFGTSSNDIANDVFADSSRGVYVVGTTGGTFPGQTDEGNIDAFIRKYNADGDEEWTRQFGTSEGATANGVSADSSGGVYVVGFTNGELPGQTDEGGADAFIRKYNSEGDEEWTRQFGTSSHDIANDVFADSSRGVYVVGTTEGTFPGQTDEGEADAYIRKYNSEGDEEWTRQFGTSEIDVANDVFADSSRGVYDVGATGGTLQEDEPIADAFISKYNADGDEEWTRQFGTSEGATANGVSADSSGGVYVVGFTNGELPGQTDEGIRDAFISKYNADGDEEWTRQFGTSGIDDASGVSADSSGGVYVVGTMDSGDPLPAGEEADAYIRKYNSEGDEEWTRQFGTSSFDIALGVSADSSGGVYVAGYTGGTFPGQINEGGETDAFFAKFAIDDDDHKKKH